jgi:hypothetical protein
MDATEQAVDSLERITFQGTEVALRLSGAGTKHAIALLYAIAASQKKTKGKTSLKGMLKSGKPLKVFQIKKEDLGAFAKDAKRYSVLYAVVIDKDADKVDVIATADSAAMINRVIENLRYGEVDVTDVVADIEREREREGVELEEQNGDAVVATLLMKPSQKEGAEPTNPTQATAGPHPSKPISDKRGRSFEDSKGGKADSAAKDMRVKDSADNERLRRSVKAEIAKIKAKRQERQTTKQKPEKSRQTKHTQPTSKRKRAKKLTKAR